MDPAGINSGIPVTGLDLINLPTNGVAGANLVTNVIGARWKPSGHVEMGFGWEYPLTENGDIMKNCVYTDLILLRAGEYHQQTPRYPLKNGSFQGMTTHTASADFYLRFADRASTISPSYGGARCACTELPKPE